MPERPDEHRRALVSIKVAGSPLSDAGLRALAEVRVEQSLHVADAFTLRFNDHDLALIGGKTFDLGMEVEVGVDVNGVVTRLMTGEVTALSAELDGLHQQQFVVAGLDRRHRLARGVKVRTFVNQTDGAAITTIARDYGLRVSADSTPGVHDYLLQCGTDYEFVGERARVCGFDWWVQDQTLHFKRPVASGPAPEVTWGSGLRRFKLRLSSAESASEAIVRGWNPVTQEALVGTAPMAGARGAGVELATDASLVKDRVGKGPQKFPAKRFAWGAPVKDQGEAKALATALAHRATSEQAVAKGETLGNPKLRPGVSVSIKGVADALCGTYLLTRVEHILGADRPYLTRFESGGEADHTLVDLLGGSGPRAGTLPGPTLGSSLVVGLVTNNTDPDKLGRVKVKFPGLAATEESAWARVVSTGAGGGRGLQVVPDVNDEVLVGFEHGDVRRPLVLGGLWSSKNAHPEHTTKGAKGGAVWQTKAGHLLTMSDGESAAERYIRLALHTGTTSLRLGEDKSALDVEKDLAVNGGAAITIGAKNDVTIEANTITLKARNKLILEGKAGVDIKSSGPVQVQGVNVELKGQAKVAVQGGAMAELKGGIVKIN
ncbi:MAG: VgrG-related protein [Acidimicrobiia bacterium]